MATKLNNLDLALEGIREKKMTFRQAAEVYGIPKSTLYDHHSGKIKGTKRGPPTVLTEAEERALADWALDMAKIGYGHTREQIVEMVKQLLDNDGRVTPFVDNRPGRDWWHGFLQSFPSVRQSN